MNKTIENYAFISNSSGSFVNPLHHKGGTFLLEGKLCSEDGITEKYVTSPVLFFLRPRVVLTKNGSIYHLCNSSEEYKKFLKE